jgi:hypothetical protein
MNMIFNSRIYYRRLLTWTRAFLISKYYGIGTAEESFGRLYLESLDISNMLEIVFGRENANQYSQYICQFAINLRDLITAQQAGNTEAVNEHVNALYENVVQRSAFLASINPYFNKSEWQSLLNTYIQVTLEEANAIAAGDYSTDLQAYVQLTDLANRMGDTFAQGLYDYITSGEQRAGSQPPQGVQCITYEQVNEVFDIRMFWFELATWIRTYMLSKYIGLGDVNQAYARLKQVPVIYVDQLERIFGNKVPEDYIQLFNQYIELLDAFINAQMTGNVDEINRITQQLYQNADQRAAAITSINPAFWDETEWRSRLYNNLRSTIDESTTLLTGNYARNIDIFRTLLDQAESTSSYFAQGVLNFLLQDRQQ